MSWTNPPAEAAPVKSATKLVHMQGEERAYYCDDLAARLNATMTKDLIDTVMADSGAATDVSITSSMIISRITSSILECDKLGGPPEGHVIALEYAKALLARQLERVTAKLEELS